MKSNGNSQKRVSGIWVGAVAAVFFGWFFFVPMFGEGLSNLSYDLLLLIKGNTPPPTNVVIVYQDSESALKLGQTNGVWDRKLLAQLLRRLKNDDSGVVIFDLVFDNPSRAPEDDAVLADAVRAHGKVTLSDNKLIPIFRTNAAAVGVERVYPDSDNAVRKLFSGRTLTNGEEEVAFTWKAAELAGAPITRQPGERDRFRSVRYYGMPGTVASLTFFDALSNAPPGYFSGQIVLVGAPNEIKDVGVGRDTFSSPYKWGKTLFAGVEVHATILANLAHSEWWILSLPMQALVLTLFAIFIGLVLVAFRPVLATVVALVSAVLVLAAAYVSAWQLRFWFPWLIMVIEILAALGGSVLYHWMKGKLERQFLEQSLSMYLSPKLVAKFSRDKDLRLLQPGAVKQRLTIMFSDIASFTSISEGMDSDELAKMMNEYFQGAVGNCIHPSDGTVVKYIGDAIFAFWNAPEPQSDHAFRACEAALRFRGMCAQEFRGKKLVTRIGLHTGVANVGNFGSATRVDYTAIGEDVNLASRMEGLNKYLGTSVLMTGAVKQEIGDQFVTRYLGKFQLKGFERAVEVYELRGKRGDAVEAAEFQTGLRLFQQRDFAAAEKIFRQLCEGEPRDGAIQFYLKHIEELRGHELPDQWNGEVELKEK